MRSIMIRIVAFGMAATAACSVAAAEDWTFDASIDLVYAGRGGPNGLILEDAISGDPLITGDSFDLGWAPGVDVQANAYNDTWGVGFRYLGGFNWDDRIGVAGPTAANFPTDPTLFLVNPGEIAAGYSSDFNSVEVNGIWRAMPNVNVFGGVRWVGIGDDLVMDAEGSNNNSVTLSMLTDSRGLGPQIGAEVRLIEPTQGSMPIFLDVDARIGAVYFKHESVFAALQDIGPIFNASGEEKNWSFMGEIGAKIGAQICENGFVTLGYRAVYLNRVSQAAGQFSGTDVVAQTINPSQDSFWMHGVTAGFELRF